MVTNQSAEPHETPTSLNSPDADARARPQIVTIEDLDAVDIEAPIRDLGVADAYTMSAAYRDAITAGSGLENTQTGRAYALLRDICGIGLRPSDRAVPWYPMISFANGARSAIPTDYRGPQTQVLSRVINRIVSPGLKARIADVAWSNNRCNGGAAIAAAAAYCDCIEGLLNGTIKTSHGRNTTCEAHGFMARAIRLAQDSTSRKARPPRVAETFELLYAAASEQRDFQTFVNMIELALDYQLRQPAIAAAALEVFVASNPAGTHPMDVKRASDLAAKLYHDIGDQEARQRCLKISVKQLLAMRDKVKGSAGAEAAWVQQALMVMRHIKGIEEDEHALEIELRRLQMVSLKDMGSIEVDLRLEGVPERVIELFSRLSISESFKQFGMMSRSRDPEKLRAEALLTRESAPLMSMMSVNHVDGAGRTESVSAGAPANGDPDETWFLRTIGQAERLYRARLVRGCLHPARTVMQARFGIEERHFDAIVGLSSFIPEGQKPIMALGFARLFQGDFISSAYLLIPQLEPCLRHLLKINDIDPAKRRDDGTEENLSLGALLSRFKPHLENILTAPLVCEINLLFNAKPGPELRHEVAHGEISGRACYSDDLLYSCWFMFHLSCLFVLQDWEKLITPQLLEEE